MTVTFNLHTTEDYEWLVQILSKFQNKNLNIQIQDDTGLVASNKRKQFLDYFDTYPVTVDKIEIPNRDGRNSR